MEQPKRINADVQAARQGTNIHMPIAVGAVQTVVVVLLEANGTVRVAGPLNDPSLMTGLLKRAQAMVDQHQQTKLVQPVNGVLRHGS